jgi:hypothetical protein
LIQAPLPAEPIVFKFKKWEVSMRRVFLIVLIIFLFAPEAGATNKHAGHFKQTLNKFIETARKQNPSLLEASKQNKHLQADSRPEKLVERSHAYIWSGKSSGGHVFFPAGGDDPEAD